MRLAELEQRSQTVLRTHRHHVLQELNASSSRITEGYHAVEFAPNVLLRIGGPELIVLGVETEEREDDLEQQRGEVRLERLVTHRVLDRFAQERQCLVLGILRYARVLQRLRNECNERWSKHCEPPLGKLHQVVVTLPVVGLGHLGVPESGKESVNNPEGPFVQLRMHAFLDIRIGICRQYLCDVRAQLEPPRACALLGQRCRQSNLDTRVVYLQNELEKGRGRNLVCRLQQLLSQSQQPRHGRIDDLLERLAGLARRLHLELASKHANTGKTAVHLSLVPGGHQRQALVKEGWPAKWVVTDHNQLDTLQCLCAQVGLVGAVNQHLDHVVLHKSLLCFTDLVITFDADGTLDHGAIVVDRARPELPDHILGLNGRGLADLKINLCKTFNIGKSRVSYRLVNPKPNQGLDISSRLLGLSEKGFCLVSLRLIGAKTASECLNQELLHFGLLKFLLAPRCDSVILNRAKL